MIGKRFGKLTVISAAGRSPRRYILWKCRCDCGRETIVSSHNLRSGNTQSCGCRLRERTRMLNFVTGQYKSRLYRIWTCMKTRCYNPNTPQYKDWGGRGITMCDEWRHNFKSFYDWSMSNGYNEHLSIDRINNDGNYEPSNCKWSTAKEQANNRRAKSKKIN